MWEMNGGMGIAWMVGMMGVSLLVGLGLLTLVIVGIIAGVRWLSRSGGDVSSGAPSDRALDTLRERYAKGEINRDEFERIRRDLS